jgi:diacylglycerol kinase
MPRTDHGLFHRWHSKFAEAFHGIALVAKYESSFRVHLVAAVCVIAVATILKCDFLEWCLLLGSIGAVLAAEAFNAAVETLFHALDDATKQRMTGCLDRAAGAVLLTAIFAATIGTIVFVRKMIL